MSKQFKFRKQYDAKHDESEHEIARPFSRLRGFAHVEVCGRLNPCTAASLAQQMMIPDMLFTERNELLSELRHARCGEHWIDIARLISFEGGAFSRQLLVVPNLIAGNMKKRACEQLGKRI